MWTFLGLILYIGESLIGLVWNFNSDSCETVKSFRSNGEFLPWLSTAYSVPGIPEFLFHRFDELKASDIRVAEVPRMIDSRYFIPSRFMGNLC